MKRSSTITCAEVVELLSDYLSESLPRRTRSVLRSHLAHCHGCSEYERQLVAILQVCRELPPEQLSEGQMNWLLAAFANTIQGDSMSDYPVTKTDKEWRQLLGPNRFPVLRRGATEAPFSGDLVNVEGEGVFTCARSPRRSLIPQRSSTQPAAGRALTRI